MPWSLNDEIREIEKISIQVNANFNIIKEFTTEEDCKVHQILKDRVLYLTVHDAEKGKISDWKNPKNMNHSKDRGSDVSVH